MKKVMQATENRIDKMVKADCKFSKELLQLITEMKCRISCYGATIKEINTYEIEGLRNENQFNVYNIDDFLGMGYLFQDYLTVANTLDLHHVTIKDFNNLVKACYDKYMKMEK